jgi:hypothetical protein
MRRWASRARTLHGQPSSTPAALELCSGGASGTASGSCRSPSFFSSVWQTLFPAPSRPGWILQRSSSITHFASVVALAFAHQSLSNSSSPPRRWHGFYSRRDGFYYLPSRRRCLLAFLNAAAAKSGRSGSTILIHALHTCWKPVGASLPPFSPFFGF